MGGWMTSSMRGVGLACAAMLVVAGAVAGDGQVRTVVEFDAEQGEFPEGVAATRYGHVFTGLTSQGRLMKIPSGESEATEHAVVDLTDGDFGLVGQTIGPDGQIFSAVVSQDPGVHGVLSFPPNGGEWEHLPGTEAMAMPNAVAVGDDLTIYITDSISGTVWRVPWAGFVGWTEAGLWVADPLLEGTGDLPLPFPVGANGIATDEGVVYVGVTEQGHIVGIPIGADGAAGEPFVHLALTGVVVDGIAITDDGDFLVADPPANTIWRVAPDSEPVAIADADDGISAPTSVYFEIGRDSEPTVYVANGSYAVTGDLAPHGPSIMAITLE